MERDPRSRYGGRSGATVGLDNVAIYGDLPLTERFEVHHGAQAAADEPLDFDGAAVLLACGRLASRPLQSGARQHTVFGRDPAAGLALEPRRQAILERRRDQHVRVAELHEAGALGVFYHA